MIAVLIGCGLRRADAAALKLEDIQLRDGHWVIADLNGKGGRSYFGSGNWLLLTREQLLSVLFLIGNSTDFGEGKGQLLGASQLPACDFGRKDIKQRDVFPIANLAGVHNSTVSCRPKRFRDVLGRRIICYVFGLKYWQGERLVEVVPAIALQLLLGLDIEIECGAEGAINHRDLLHQDQLRNCENRTGPRTSLHHRGLGIRCHVETRNAFWVH